MFSRREERAMPSAHQTNRPRMTLATVASLIIDDEYMARARAKAEAMTDDELRDWVCVGVAAEARFFSDAGEPVPDDLPDPDTMARRDRIEFLVGEAGGSAITEAIPGDADDPLVLDAQELRRESWEQNVVTVIKRMGLTGPAAVRHRAAAEAAELTYLRRLTKETWELPEADLRLRTHQIVTKLAGGDDGDRQFPYDPTAMSRGSLLAAIAAHISGLASSPGLRPSPAAAE
jgi:hypothetical protein